LPRWRGPVKEVLSHGRFERATFPVTHWDADQPLAKIPLSVGDERRRGSGDVRRRETLGCLGPTNDRPKSGDFGYPSATRLLSANRLFIQPIV